MNNIYHLSEQRKRQLLTLLIIIPVGFYTKCYSGPAADWVNNSLGGVFYEVFWCLLFALIFRNGKPVIIASIVFCTTCFLEMLQLWQNPLLTIIRSNFIGGIVLGSSFSWYDFPYYFARYGIGYVLIKKNGND